MHLRVIKKIRKKGSVVIVSSLAGMGGLIVPGQYSYSISKNGLCALEFESPYKKKDLLRFKDDYGRQSKNYEGK
mgnify:CR=1 FL=1